MGDTIQSYVSNHTARGECKCGRCIYAGESLDPITHSVDMTFFVMSSVGEPTAADFVRLTQSAPHQFAECDPLDGKDHNFIEIGAWLGDQGLALLYMGLGVSLGLFELLSPKTVLGLNDLQECLTLAGGGFLSVRALPEVSHV